MYKVIYSLILFFLGMNPIFCQVFENALKDSVIYLTPQEEAFMIDKETKYLFKVIPLGASLVGIATRQSLSFAFEKKVSQAFSISLLADLPQFYNGRGSNGELVKNVNWRLGSELRHYYQMSRLIKNNKQADNLTGRYVGFRYNRSWNTGGTNDFGTTNSFQFSWGEQKRFLNRGFVDYSIGLGLRHNVQTIQLVNGPTEGSQLNFFLSAGIKAGLALGKNYNLSDDVVCPIFRCHANRKAAFKINLVRNWSVGRNQSFFGESGAGTWYLSLNPDVGFELKIANSPLAFVQDVDFNIYFSSIRFDEPGFGISSWALRYYPGFRYYHGMMNRIKKGKSGNNLSGIYSFARAKLERSEFLSFILDPDTGLFNIRQEVNKEIEAQVGVGYQKEVLERLYFDLGIGATKDVKRNADQILQGVGLTSYIKVGLMF